MKRWKRKHGFSDRKPVWRNITPNHLDFESDKEELGDKDPKVTFSDVETDKENPD